MREYKDGEIYYLKFFNKPKEVQRIEDGEFDEVADEEDQGELRRLLLEGAKLLGETSDLRK